MNSKNHVAQNMANNKNGRRVTSSSNAGVTPCDKSRGLTPSASLKRNKQNESIGEVIGEVVDKVPPPKRKRILASNNISNTAANSLESIHAIQPDLQIITPYKDVRTFRKPKINQVNSNVRFERYRSYYNGLYMNDDNKPILTEHLRSSHLFLFKQLIGIAIKEARLFTETLSHSYKFELGQYFELKLNRAFLEEHVGATGTAIRRQLIRLEKSGVLHTEFHGTDRPFSVYIDTQFLSFHECQSKPHNEAVKALQRTICIPYRVLEHSKKVIIDVHKSEKILQDKSQENGISAGYNETRTETRTTPEHTGTPQEPTQEQWSKCDGLSPVENATSQKESSAGNSPPKPRFTIDAPLDKTQDYALSMVYFLWALIMEKLYKERTIHPVEQIRAQKLIYMQVFRHATSRQKVDALEYQWKWRIQKAADFMTSRRFSNKGAWLPPMPSYFFDVEKHLTNKVNFEWTAVKYAEFVQKEQKKRKSAAIKRKRKDDNYVLMRVLGVVWTYRTREAIEDQGVFVRANYPHLVTRFDSALQNPDFINIMNDIRDKNMAKRKLSHLIKHLNS